MSATTNWIWYRRKVPVLARSTDEECEAHYVTFGREQGITNEPILWTDSKEKLYRSIIDSPNNLPKDFDLLEYKKCNPDISKESDLYVVHHYLYHGIREGRVYDTKLLPSLPRGFCVEIYKGLNPDLGKFSEEQLKSHYIQYGVEESRQYEDKLFDESFFLIRNNFKNNTNPYKTYLNDIRLFKSRAVEELVSQMPFYKKDYILINHLSNINGATHSLYILANFLKSKRHSIVILDPYKQSEDVYKKYNLSLRDFLFYQEDPTLLYWYCAKIKCSKIIANSFNFAISEAIQWIDRSKLLLFSRELKRHYVSRSCYDPDVVITPSISDSYASKPVIQTPICPSFLQKRIYKDYSKQVTIQNLNETKIAIGMCGTLTKRKNYDIFLDVAKQLPEYNFIWIGGDNLNTNLSNVFHIKDTPNPFAYYKLIDYFVLFSEWEPFGNVVIENLLLNKQVLTFKDNIYFDFKDNLTNNNYFEFKGNVSTENVIKHITKTATKKQTNFEYLGSSSNQYVVENFSTYRPQFLELLNSSPVHLNGTRNVTDDGRVTVKCPMGFGNQLRLMLAGSFLVANGFIDSYTQEWVLNDHNNVNYFSYFDSLPGVNIEPIKEGIDVKYNNVIHTTCFGKMIQTFTKNKVSVNEAFQSIISQLKVKPTFGMKLNKFAKEHNISNALGIHLRETDKFEMYSRNEIARPMKDILAACDLYERVFLATDNNQAQKTFRELLGDKLITYQSIPSKTIDRRHTKASHTVADFLLLPQCKTFMGTNKSSFSTLIKHWRNNSHDYLFIENL